MPLKIEHIQCQYFAGSKATAKFIMECFFWCMRPYIFHIASILKCNHGHLNHDDKKFIRKVY